MFNQWVIVALVCMAVVSAGPVLARPHRSTGGGAVNGFRTSMCKRPSCYAEHPDGGWRHPLTAPKAPHARTMPCENFA
jgi:hypothetical protein